MLPFIPSFNQVQPQGGTGSIPPQVILSDPRLLNSSNFGSNLNPQFPPSSCPQQQNPSNNHQFPAPVPFPLDYSNTHLSSLQTNVASMPSRPPSVPFCFPNVNPSQQHQLPNLFQNGNSVGSNPQADLCNALQNLSQFAALQPNGQVLMHNLAQSLNQIMAPQMPNFGQPMFLPPGGQFCSQHPHQNLNQNAAGQFMLQNPGNLNQMLPMQCSSNPMDPTRVVPFSNSPCSNPILPHQNQRMHNSGPQSGGIPFSNSPCSNPMLPLQNQNMHTSSSHSGGILFSNSPCSNPMFLHQNKSTHTSGPQNGAVMNGNSNYGIVSNGCVQHGNQNFNVSTPSNMTQNAPQKPPSFSQSQKDHAEDGRNGNSNLNQGNPMIEDFKRNPYGSRFQKFQDNHSGNTKGNFRPNTRNVGKVHPNLGAGKMHHTKFNKKPMLESKRSVLAVTYTEVEIQKWREERKKNFPTKSNLEKIFTDKQTNDDSIQLLGDETEHDMELLSKVGIDRFTNRKPVKDLKWIPPDPGWVKINSDASLSQQGVGLGAVCRNCHGDVEWLCSIKLDAGAEGSILRYEMEAALTALSYLEEASSVWLEMDSKVCVDIINGICGCPRTEIIIKTKILQSLARYSNWRVTHIWREGNKVADHLSKISPLNDTVMDPRSLPFELTCLIAHDRDGSLNRTTKVRRQVDIMLRLHVLRLAIFSFLSPFLMEREFY